MLYCEARRPARRSDDNRFVPLSEQDPKDWRMDIIEEAESELATAFQMRRPGRFQIEAAIQSVHAERAHTGRTDSAAIAAFYDQLMQLAPSIGGAVARAAAHGEVRGPEAGLTLLAEIDSQAVISYQPFWAVRAHLLRQLGRTQAAADAYDRAIGLSEDPAVRTFLTERRNH
jgi:RNA polymerase sigma-70 factor (ECF subfamily)